MTQTETVIKGDHERLRHTITVSGGSASLTDAESVEWFLTTRPGLGDGTVALSKDDGDAGLSIVDGDTFEVELEPEETETLEARRHYAECTITWDGNPSTAALGPAIAIESSAHSQQ